MSIWQIPEDIKYSCPNLVDFVKAVKPVFHDENGKRIKIMSLNFACCLLQDDYRDICKDSAYCECKSIY